MTERHSARLAEATRAAQAPGSSTTWKDDYIREYVRTTDGTMTIGQALPGGYVEVLTTSPSYEGTLRSKMRKGQIIANTQRLRQRPDAAQSTSARAL